MPQEGTVYKHPALRIGYVSQHATHHIGTQSHTLHLMTLPHAVSCTTERHLEKTPIQYIQWRFQDGHDRGYIPAHNALCGTLINLSRIGEILEKATRILTDEEKAIMDTDFVGKNGQRRKLEVRLIIAIVTRPYLLTPFVSSPCR